MFQYEVVCGLIENFGGPVTVEDGNGIWAKIAVASYDTIRTECFVSVS